jgi:hypothetical protein
MALVIAVGLVLTAVATGDDSELERLRFENAELRRGLEILAGQLDETNAGVQAGYRAAWEARYAHQIYLMKHTERALAWQHRASTAILWMVGFVVAAGLLFSGAQLFKALSAGTVHETTEMTVEAGRVQVRSSVIGIVVLVLSLGFLYLFLNEVYRIEPLQGPTRRPTPIVQPTPSEDPEGSSPG